MSIETDGELFGAIEQTMQDTMNNVSEPSAPADEPAEHEAEAPTRARDEQGRFAKTAKEEAAQAEEEQSEVLEQETEEEQEQKPVVNAPGSWPKDLKEKFGSLPPEVQQYINDRESGFSRTLNEYTVKAKNFDSLTQRIQPYEAMLRAEGADVGNAVESMLQTAYALRTAPPMQKAQLVAGMIQQFGVDLSLLGMSTEGQEPATGYSPYIDEIYQRQQRLEEQLQQQAQMKLMEEQRQIQSQIEQFAQSKPHFEAVRAEIGALLSSGRAQSLDQAYEMAIWANPETRATLQAEQEAKRREEARVKAEQAKKANAVNLQRRGIQPPGAAPGSMDDTMRQVYRRLNG